MKGRSALDALMGAGAVTRSAAIDSTYIEAQRSAGRVRVIGRSPGRRITKVHALTDVVGRLRAPMLTPGNVADMIAAPELLARMETTRYLLTDKGFDADPLRRSLHRAGAVAVISGRSNRKRRSLRPQTL